MCDYLSLSEQLKRWEDESLMVLMLEMDLNCHNYCNPSVEAIRSRTSRVCFNKSVLVLQSCCNIELHLVFPATNKWSLVKVKGEGPCARRRQCCCLVGDKVFLFGGTW